MPSHRAEQSALVPGGWTSQYVMGFLVVLGCLIGGMFATEATVSQLIADVRAGSVSSCAGAASPGCRADYQATVISVGHGDSNSLVLSTSFLADTAKTDECFASNCHDQVELRSADLSQLHSSQGVTIGAGQGRIYTVSANGSTWPTFDSSGISVLDAAADLTAAAYLDTFGIAWLAAYLFLTLRFRTLGVVAMTLRRSLNVASALGLAGAVVSFVAFALGGPQELILLAAGLLILGGAALVARRHPETGPSAQFTADDRWRPAYQRSLADAFYVLCAIPLELSVALAFRLAHDDGTIIGPVIAALIGLAITAFIMYRLHRSLTGARRTTAALTSAQ